MTVYIQVPLPRFLTSDDVIKSLCFQRNVWAFVVSKEAHGLKKILNKTKHNFCFTVSLPAPFLAARPISFSHTHTQSEFWHCGVNSVLITSFPCNHQPFHFWYVQQNKPNNRNEMTEGSVAPRKTTVRRSHKERHRAGQLMWKQNRKTNIVQHNHSVAGGGEKSQLFALLRGAGIAPLLRWFAGSLLEFKKTQVKKSVGRNLPEFLQSQHCEHLFYSKIKIDKCEKMTGLVWSATVWIRCGRILQRDRCSWWPSLLSSASQGSESRNSAVKLNLSHSSSAIASCG